MRVVIYVIYQDFIQLQCTCYVEEKKKLFKIALFLVRPEQESSRTMKIFG